MPETSSEITTKRFHLKPLTRAEAPLLANLGADPDVVKTLVFDWSTPAKRLKIANFWIDRNQEFGIWGVYDEQGLFGTPGTMIGFCAADEPLPEVGKGPEIYYAFSRETWGNGVATEVVRMVIAYLFTELKVRAVEALVLSGMNTASNRLLEKLGMQLVGRYPFAEYIGSACESTIEYEIWRVANSPQDRAKQNLEEAAFKIGQFVGDGAAQESAMIESLQLAAFNNGLIGKAGKKDVLEIIEGSMNKGKSEDGWLYYRVSENQERP